MAPFGLKLWGNAFQTIPNISFFDVDNNFFFRFLVFEIQIWAFVCPGQETYVSWPRDICVLAKRQKSDPAPVPGGRGGEPRMDPGWTPDGLRMDPGKSALRATVAPTLLNVVLTRQTPRGQRIIIIFKTFGHIQTFLNNCFLI